MVGTRQHHGGVTTTTPPEPFTDRDAWATTNCSIARTLDVIGTRSTLLVLREAFLGTRRFDDFRRRVGVTEAVAAARLRDLVDAGLLARRPYREPGQRTRDEYVLTQAGRDLWPVMTALREWGDAHVADDAGAPVRVWHEACGSDVHVEVRCAEGHVVRLGEAAAGPGPGALPASA